jgi:hypothetical protein
MCFPLKFKTTNGRKYILFDCPELHSKNYIILESLDLDKKTKKTVYVLTPNALKNSFKIGRDNNADLKLFEISCSRRHATIEF